MNGSVLISVNQKSHRLVAFVVCLLILIIIYFYIIIVVFADIFLFPFWIFKWRTKISGLHQETPKHVYVLCNICLVIIASRTNNVHL